MTSLASFSVKKAILPNPLAVSPQTRVGDAIAQMSQTRSSCVLVLEGQELVGIFTERDLVRLIAAEAVSESATMDTAMTQPAIAMREAEVKDVFAVLNLMRQHCIRHLPLVNEAGGAIGLITAESLRQALNPADLLKLRRVEEVMTRQVVCTSTETSLLELVQQMAAASASCVVIRERGRRGDGEEGGDGEQRSRGAEEQRRQFNPKSKIQPVGIITERDIAQFQALGLDFRQTRAREVMSAPVRPIAPRDSLWVAHQQMKQLRVRRLLVCNSEGELVGLVTQSSILHALDTGELYDVVQVLQQEVEKLQDENQALLRDRNRYLEQQVEDCSIQLQAREEREHLLATIALRIRQSLNLEEILNTTVREVRELLQSDRVMIYRFDPDGSGIVTVESVSDPQWSILGQVVRDACFEEDWIAAYRQPGSAKAIEDVRTADIEPCYREFLDGFNIKANLVVPILLGTGEMGSRGDGEMGSRGDGEMGSRGDEGEGGEGENIQSKIQNLNLWGLLIAHECRSPRQWKESEMEFIEQLATQVAIAIQQATLLERLQSELQERATAQQTICFQASLLEAVEQAVIATDLEGKIISWNRYAQTLYGWTAAEVLGRSILEVTPAEATQAHAAEIMACLQRGESWSGEFLVQRKDGTTFIASVTDSPIYDERGTLIGIVGVSVDISDRVAAETALRQSEATLHSFFDSAPMRMGIVELTDDDDILHIADNVVAARGFGLTPEAMQNQRDSELGIDSACIQLWRDRYREAERTQFPVRFEYSYEIAGAIIWLSASVSQIASPSDNPPRFAYIVEDISDRKRAEQHLRDSERRFRAIFNNTFQLTGLLTPDGRVMEVNQTALDFGGIELANILGQPFWEVLWWTISPDTQQQLRDEIARAARGEFTRYTTDVFKAGGALATLDFSLKPVKNEAGQVVFLVAEGRDITEIKQAEAALRESQERWQLAMRGANDGIWDWNVPTNEVFFSPRWKEMLGYEEHEIGNSIEEWDKRVHPDDRAYVYQAIQDHFDGKTDFYITEHRVQCKDGSYKWILDRGKALRDENGQIVRMAGSHTDTSDRKMAEEALRRSEEHLRMALEASHLGTWDWDIPNNRIGWSSGHAELFGIELGAFDGTFAAFEVFIHPDDREGVIQAVERSRLNRQDYHHEFRIRWPDGSIRWIEGRGKFFYEETGRAVRMLGVIADASDRKQREEILRNIAAGVSAKTGEAFFQSLVEYLSKTLNVEYAFVCELIEPQGAPAGSGEATHGKTIASYGNGQRLENCEYDLANTPCETVADKQLRVYPRNVQQLFPRDTILVNLGIESYMGAPLFDSTGRPLGLVNVMSRQPIEDSGLMAEILKIFAARASSELERGRIEEELERFFTLSLDLLCVAGIDGYFKRLNPAFSETFGYTQQELLAQPFIEFVHPDDLAATRAEAKKLAAGQPLLDFENRYRCKDGSYRWISWKSYPVPDKGLIYAVARDVTENKAAEEALRQSEAKNRAIVAAIPDLMLRISWDGVYLDYIPAKTHGELLTSERIGKHLSEVLPSELVPRQMHYIRQAIATGEVQSFEQQLSIGDKQYYQEVRIAAIGQDEVLVMIRDISDRKAAEIQLRQAKAELERRVAERTAALTRANSRLNQELEERRCTEIALRESERRYATLAEVSPVGIFRTNPRGNCSYVNERWCEMAGMTSEEALGEGWIEAIHPEDRDRVIREWYRAAGDNLPFQLEYRFQDASGTTKWVFGQAVADRDAEGQILGYVGSVTDISDRKAAEATLQEAERRWRILLESVRLLVVGLDRQGKIDYVNPFFLELTGYTQAEVLGKDWFDTFLLPSQRAQFKPIFQEILEQDDLPYYQNSILTKLGEEKIISWNNTRLKNLQGEAIGLMSIGEDITERYAIDRMKNEFISVVSHELRTPLTSIHGALNLLSTGLVKPESERGQYVIKIAAESAERLVRLVNDILELERLESGKIKLVKREVNAADLMRQAVEQMQVTAERAGIAISASEPDLAFYADGDRIIQVLTNLLSNAIKFSNPGSTVWLSAELEEGAEEQRSRGAGETGRRGDGEDEGDSSRDKALGASVENPTSNVNIPNALSVHPIQNRSTALRQAQEPRSRRSPKSKIQNRNVQNWNVQNLKFIVQDRGRGIPADKLDSIFERFHQVDASDSREKGGTGLGLAICRSIVEQHGGKIWVESILDEGSSFYFTVPVQIGEDDTHE